MSRYSTELYHHGILGQKWGKKNGPPYPLDESDHSAAEKKAERRHTDSSFNVRSKNGDTLSVEREKTSKVAKALAKVSKTIAKNVENDSSFTIKNKDENVGELHLTRKSPIELNVNWIEIDDVQRGKGYAQSVLKGVIKEAEKDGYKYITLEVPGISPDAAHVYEKLGFNYVNRDLTSKDDVWGGLSSMRKDI